LPVLKQRDNPAYQNQQHQPQPLGAFRRNYQIAKKVPKVTISQSLHLSPLAGSQVGKTGHTQSEDSDSDPGEYSGGYLPFACYSESHGREHCQEPTGDRTEPHKTQVVEVEPTNSTHDAIDYADQAYQYDWDGGPQ
jgi:hypothetical protein